MIPDKLIRQSDVVPMNILGKQITVIGAGAIGSFVVLTLAKMGFSNIKVYDFDKVDEVNLSSQFYRHTDIGKLKVDALQDLVKSFTDITITAKGEAYENQRLDGVVITAVDSMTVRKAVITNNESQTFTIPLVLDPRMSIETALLYSYRPMNLHECSDYKKTLYSNEDSVQERCTGKATMYTAIMLSGLVCRCVRDFLVSGKRPTSIQWDIKSDDLVSFSKT